MSAVVATAAFGLLSYAANAQQAPAIAKPATPPPAAAAPPPPAPAAKAPATAPAATTAAKPAPKPSPCKGLNETACKAKSECSYVVPTTANPTTGKVPAPYCRKTVSTAAKKPAAPAAVAKPATPPPAPAAAPKQ